MSDLSRIRLFVLDLDGTFYLGDRLYDYSLDFLKSVEDSGRSWMFFTNNASRSPEEYVRRLTDMGCPITREQIMTAGDVMIRYLKKYYDGAAVFLLGTPSLAESFADAGIRLADDEADVVVVSFDRSLTYDRLNRACRLIRGGAVFLATHPDINCPVPGGFDIDCGSICAAISLSTGKTPLALGKPAAQTLEMICDAADLPTSAIAFVGDRLYTDVATGVQNGAAGYLVLSGESTRADIEKYGIVPDEVFADLSELAERLRQEAPADGGR